MTYSFFINITIIIFYFHSIIYRQGRIQPKSLTISCIRIFPTLSHILVITSTWWSKLLVAMSVPTSPFVVGPCFESASAMRNWRDKFCNQTILFFGSFLIPMYTYPTLIFRQMRDVLVSARNKQIASDFLEQRYSEVFQKYEVRKLDGCCS